MYLINTDAPRISTTNWGNLGFHCVSEAWPNATVEWLKGNGSSSIYPPQLFEQWIFVLPGTPRDTVFTCVAKNKVGSTSKSVTFQGIRSYVCMYVFSR